MKILEIKPDKRSFETALSLLQHIPGAAQKAAATAINETNKAAKKKAAAAVQEVYAIKHRREINKTLKVVWAKSNSLYGELRSKGKSISLRHFAGSPRDKDTTGANRRPIRVAVLKENPPKPLATGFISSSKNNQIFRRTGKPRPTKSNPDAKGWIKKAESVSTPQMQGNAKVGPHMQNQMQAAFEEKMQQAVNDILSGGGKKK